MPTTIEYALMSGASYVSTRPDVNKFPIPDGWHQVSYSPPVPSGFEAAAFGNGIDIGHSTEVVISFAGTYDKDLTGDWVADFNLGTGAGSAQLLQAVKYYLQVKAQIEASANPNATITLTGHSLGGGLAALVGVFFGIKAVTFDQAPFANSALSGVAAQLKADLLALGYNDDDLTGLTNYLQQREENGGIPNSNLVSNIRVDGEFLSSAPIGLLNIIGTTLPQNVLMHGPYSNPSTDMHSMSLLTAFLQNDQFRVATTELTDLLKMIFDQGLFYRETDTDKPNFLEHLVRHQEGLDPTVPNDGDHMLDRFTADLKKIAQDGGPTMSNSDLTKALTAFAMQAYYNNRLAAGEELFESVSGGIHFDMSNVADTLEGENGAKGYTGTDSNGQMFKAYLNSLAYSNVKSALVEQLPNLLDRFIQAGGSGMTATAGDQRAFVLSGSADDYFRRMAA